MVSKVQLAQQRVRRQKRRLKVGLTCIGQQVEHPTFTTMVTFDQRRSANLKFSLIKIDR
jgi:hypothetical protein